MKRMLNANFASDRSDNEGKRGVWDAYEGAYGHRKKCSGVGKKRMKRYLQPQFFLK